MNYILQKDFNWFGKNIPAGTMYVQHGADYWWPVINGAYIPAMQVDFMTVRKNEEWFKPDPIQVCLFEGCFGNHQGVGTYLHSFHTNQPIPEHLRDRIEKLIQEVINK